jgi:hypothetical protein
MGPLGINRITTAITHTVQDQLERAARSEIVESLTHSGAGQTVKKAAATAGALAGQATDTISTEWSKGIGRQSKVAQAARDYMDTTFTKGAWIEPVAAAGSLAGVGVAAVTGNPVLAAAAGTGLMATTWPKEAVNQAVLKASSTLRDSADMALPFAAISSASMTAAGLANETLSVLSLLPVGLSAGVSQLANLAERKLATPARIATMNAETMINANLKAKADELGPWQKTVGLIADNSIVQGVEKRALEHLEALTGTTSERLETVRAAVREKADVVSKAIKHDLVPNNRLVSPAEQYVHNTAPLDPVTQTLVNEVLAEPMPVLGGPTEAQRRAMSIIKAQNMAAENPLFAPRLDQVEVPSQETWLSKKLALIGIKPEETAAQKAANEIGSLANIGDNTANAYTAKTSPIANLKKAATTRIEKVQGNLAKQADDPLVLMGRQDLITAINGRSDLDEVSHVSIDTLSRSRNEALERLTQKEQTLIQSINKNPELIAATQQVAQAKQETVRLLQDKEQAIHQALTTDTHLQQVLNEFDTVIGEPDLALRTRLEEAKQDVFEQLVDRGVLGGNEAARRVRQPLSLALKEPTSDEIMGALYHNNDYQSARTAMGEKLQDITNHLKETNVITAEEARALNVTGHFTPVVTAKPSTLGVKRSAYEAQAEAYEQTVRQALLNDPIYRMDVAQFAQKHGTESVSGFTNPMPTMGGIPFLLKPSTVSLQDQVTAQQAKDLQQDFQLAFNL